MADAVGGFAQRRFNAGARVCDKFAHPVGQAEVKAARNSRLNQIVGAQVTQNAADAPDRGAQQIGDFMGRQRAVRRDRKQLADGVVKHRCIVGGRSSEVANTPKRRAGAYFLEMATNLHIELSSIC
ncbi:hypothetical protein [Deinococcus multiflagellatus]|uniref:Uncharacterized protein n=1 Tax=Deinococcus multiflagellatus TaxID=1656887 RepID=A0ABW1ZRQ7_9DEIO|nr:hypothetical protein [Deinococcus multiflagellatus]MBZ9714422.1 hypothetical protein [Deinococcus multiflagellatus]